jgi:hypothetical protein
MHYFNTYNEHGFQEGTEKSVTAGVKTNLDLYTL